MEYSNYWLGVAMWGTPLGGPPRGPHSPPRGPRVSQSSGKNCKNSQQLYKNCTYIKIPQILTLTPILGHLSTLGGPRGAKILKWPCRGVIWKIGYGFFGTFVLFLVTLHYSGVQISNFDLGGLSHPPNIGTFWRKLGFKMLNHCVAFLKNGCFIFWGIVGWLCIE